MKIQHRSLNKTFKLNAWQGVFGNSTSIFKQSNVQEDIGPMLEYLFKELEDSMFARSQRNLFSLVNIYSPVSGHSVGYSETPPAKIIKSDTGLVLTFALVSRPLRKTPKDVFINNISDYSSYWGKSVIQLTDYYVVNIRRGDLVRWKIRKTLLKDDLLYLYNVIGPTTKSFIENEGSWFNVVGQHYPVSTLPDPDIIAGKYLTKTLPNMFKTVPPNLWIYCRDMWNKAPNLLLPKMYNPDIGLYYVMQLHNMVDIGKTERSEYFQKHVINEYVSKGVREFYSAVRSGVAPNEISDNLYAALHLIEDTVVPGGLGTYNNQRAFHLIDIAIARTKNDPDVAAHLSTAFSDTQSAARKLLYRPETIAGYVEALIR